MVHLALPSSRVRPLAFYLAMEEWAARELPPDDYFFAWRVEPTVICGRNQDIAAEVDIDYCRREGIHIVRRRSGGGAVYADMQNWMFSLVTPSDEVQTTFARYTTMVAAMLVSLGIDARATGRNDIVVGGRKISGNAFYHLPGRSIAHGTMLYRFDAGRISNALTPSRAKLESKKVVSVPMRVTSLAEQGIKMGVEEFADYAIGYLTKSRLVLTDGQIKQIEDIEQRYYQPEWINVKPASRQPAGRRVARRFESVGEVSLNMELDSAGALNHIDIEGDFFLLGDISKEICSRLIGLHPTEEALRTALADIDVGLLIDSLKNEQLISLIVEGAETGGNQAPRPYD